MDDKTHSELKRIGSLLDDVKKLLILDLYKKDNITSDDIANVLGLGSSTIRKLFLKGKESDNKNGRSSK